MIFGRTNVNVFTMRWRPGDPGRSETSPARRIAIWKSGTEPVVSAGRWVTLWWFAGRWKGRGPWRVRLVLNGPLWRWTTYRLYFNLVWVER